MIDVKSLLSHPKGRAVSSLKLNAGYVNGFSNSSYSSSSSAISRDTVADQYISTELSRHGSGSIIYSGSGMTPSIHSHTNGANLR